MRLIDWYFLRQALAPFVFFTLVLTGVIWLAQSLQIIDLIVNNGQSAGILVEFAVPLLPRVFSVVLPIAVLGGTIYALHRLLIESELVVVYAAGQGRLSAMRSVLIFGALMTCVLAVITLYLMPLGSQTLRDRTAEIRADVAAALIQDGKFLHPAPGLTVYIREAPTPQTMRGLFVSDSRKPEDRVVFHAQRGALTQTEEGPRLVMFDGMAQRVDPETGALSLLRFETLAYDLSAFGPDPSARSRKPSEHFFPDLIWPDPEMDERQQNKFIAEGHEQLSAPLYGFTVAVVAAAVMLGGPFSRRGYVGRLVMAVILGVGARLMGLVAQNLVKGNADFWPIMYAPPILASLLALFVLMRGRFRATPAAPPDVLPQGNPA